MINTLHFIPQCMFLSLGKCWTQFLLQQSFVAISHIVSFVNIWSCFFRIKDRCLMWPELYWCKSSRQGSLASKRLLFFWMWTFTIQQTHTIIHHVLSEPWLKSMQPTRWDFTFTQWFKNQYINIMKSQVHVIYNSHYHLRHTYILNLYCL